MPKLDRTHARKRIVAYQTAINSLWLIVEEYETCVDGADKVLAIEARFIADRLSREMSDHIRKYDLF